LDPIVIYLWQRDVRASLERIAHERPQEWVDFVGDYTDRGAWAQATGLGGYQGFIAAQGARQAVELALLPDLGSLALRLDVSNREWRGAQRQVAQFLRTALVDHEYGRTAAP
jgi:hypothetical protein